VWYINAVEMDMTASSQTLAKSRGESAGDSDCCSVEILRPLG
jgi:hypothetical protein